MWVVNRRDKPNDEALVTDAETLSRFDDNANYVITKVVPASDLRASEELVQRLAEVVEDRFSLEMTPSQITDRMILAFGLRKVEGRWVKIK